MKKLLMMGTTPTSIELINMAKAQGIYTITTDYLEPEQSPAKLISDEYWMISTADLDALEKKCREEGVSAVLAGISEFNIERMAELCQRLELPCWCTPESWNAIQKKHNFKRLCRENGVPVATDYYLSNPPTEEELAQIVYPVVIKPVDQNSNTGMSYCYNREDVIKGCEYARSLSKSETLIVEKKFSGTEYMAWYAIAEGEVSLLTFAASMSQPGYPGSCYEFSASDKKNLRNYVELYEPSIKKMIHAAGCREGICWIQLFLEDDQVFYALEMGYRLSGDMMCLPMREAYGFDALQWILDVALGKHHTVSDLPATFNCNSEKSICSYILWSKSEGIMDKIRGVEEIAALPGMICRLIAEEGSPFGQYEYLVVFAFSAVDHSDMIEMVNKINNTVEMLDHNGNNVCIYFDDIEAIRKVADADCAHI